MYSPPSRGIKKNPEGGRQEAAAAPNPHTQPVQTGSLQAGGRAPVTCCCVALGEGEKIEKKKKKAGPKISPAHSRASRREFLPLCTLALPPPLSAGGSCGGAREGRGSPRGGASQLLATLPPRRRGGQSKGRKHGQPPAPRARRGLVLSSLCCSSWCLGSGRRRWLSAPLPPAAAPTPRSRSGPTRVSDAVERRAGSWHGSGKGLAALTRK